MNKKHTVLKITVLVLLIQLLSNDGNNHWDNFKRGLLGQPEIPTQSLK
jgi:hypothetical protein